MCQEKDLKPAQTNQKNNFENYYRHNIYYFYRG
jgi:hypothetical protein